MAKETVPNIGESIKQLRLGIASLGSRTHAAVALVGAAIVEERLLEAVVAMMRPLSGKMKKRLFGTYGPLSTFAAKVDVAYALSIIPKSVHGDLNAIRTIRNRFAHSTGVLTFESPEIQDAFKGMRRNGDAIKHLDAYMGKLKEIDSMLEQAISGRTSSNTKFPEV